MKAQTSLLSLVCLLVAIDARSALEELFDSSFSRADAVRVFADEGGIFFAAYISLHLEGKVS